MSGEEKMETLEVVHSEFVILVKEPRRSGGMRCTPVDQDRLAEILGDRWTKKAEYREKKQTVRIYERPPLKKQEGKNGN